MARSIGLTVSPHYLGEKVHPALKHMGTFFQLPECQIYVVYLNKQHIYNNWKKQICYQTVVESNIYNETSRAKSASEITRLGLGGGGWSSQCGSPYSTLPPVGRESTLLQHHAPRFGQLERQEAAGGEGTRGEEYGHRFGDAHERLEDTYT